MREDVIILGAGAYGLMTAVFAARKGKKVLLLERNEQAGKKILISGGGRCNYTNLYTRPEAYISQNPHFTRNILSRWSVQDTLDFFENYGIRPQEKTLGQLFPVSNKARDFRDGLLQEALSYGARILYGVRPKKVNILEDGFEVNSEAGEVFTSSKIVVATGGKSIPAMGATDFGLKLAKEWGLQLIEDAPALVPFAADAVHQIECAQLSGLAVPVEVKLGKVNFRESVLFTHAGWSGPAILQISSYWSPGMTIELDFIPDETIDLFRTGKDAPGQTIAGMLPARLVQKIREEYPFVQKRPAEISKKDYNLLESVLKHWKIQPIDTLGYAKAEVMRGGVDTRELIPQTLESKKVPGSYWGGEVIDVTGWLGGYNFQWAWACGFVTGNSI